MSKTYLLAVLIGGVILFKQVKHNAQFEHCALQAAELDVKLSSINQVENIHFIATEYVAAVAACNGKSPRLTSKPIPAVLADAKNPVTIEEGKKKAAERKEGNPLL